MLRAREVADFIRGEDLGITDTPASFAINVLPDDDVTQVAQSQAELPEAPDRLVAVNIIGGGSTLHERTYDRPTIRLLVRGLARSDSDAEDLIAAADNLLMGAIPPLTMGSRRVVSINYLGGPPSFLVYDEGLRAIYACSYSLQVDREVF